jgi:hypothetical protein
MTKVTSTIERYDMNASKYDNVSVEKNQEITTESQEDSVTYFSPMVAVMIAYLCDKVSIQ